MKQTSRTNIIALCLFALFLVLCAPPLYAQRPMSAPPRPPAVVQLAVRGAEKPVSLRELSIHTEIAGRLAWTTVEMTFYNPNARVLEGELQFPLRDGQTVTGFALSMVGADGKETMRDAVTVDKTQGRQVFEEVIRQRIDPALLEMTQGNHFKLRVYPLNPGQTRRVRLVYSERLSQTGMGFAQYKLPLSYAERVEKFRLNVDIEAKGLPKPPLVTGSNAAFAGMTLAFREKGNKYIAQTNAQNVRLQGNELTLTVPVKTVMRNVPCPVPLASACSVSEENFNVFGIHGGKRYFYTEVPAPEPYLLKPPSLLGILWDASLSGQKRDHAREFAFLDAYFNKVRDVTVRLQQARDVADEPRNFIVKNGDWSALRKALESTVYDGATNLGAFDVKTAADVFFLFTDGLDNYSTEPLAAPTSPLFAVVSTAGAELPRLRGLAANGGNVIHLTATDAKSAAARAMMGYPHIVSVEGGVTDAVWMDSPEGGAFLIAGIVPDTSRGLFVTFGNGERYYVEFSAKKGLSSGVPYLWASMKIARLEEEYELHRGEIRRLGRAFSIPTRETSLIVLDRVEDYVTHSIEPPLELKAEYEQLRAYRSQTSVETNKIERVLHEWQARDAWWNTDFSKKKAAQQQRSQTKGSPTPQTWNGEGPIGCAQCDDNVSVPLVAERLVLPSIPASAELNAAPNFAAVPAIARKSHSEAEGLSTNSASTASSPGTTAIALRPWTPDATYLRRMKKARTEDVYRIYLDERPDYENSVAFYLDVAYALAQRGQKALSLRVLSNLAEMNLENRQILRVLGYRLLEAGLPKQAVLIFQRVLALAEDEPQSYRDLGLAYDAAGEHQLAVERLYDVVEKSFIRNFPGIEVIALTELNAIAANAPTPLNTQRIDSRFLVNRPLDLRATLTWDTDETDIDLHVIDPDGEEAFYGHPLSRQGGRVSPDNTQGYGPEEFTLRKAKPGKYRVEVKFYGHRQQFISDSTVIQLDFFTRFGSRNVQKQSVTMRLKKQGDKIQVGEFEVK
ncbi:MAG: DUF2135 domain-containing protein [Azoarcus sp.]|jgi:tetratricopeptide (TPR) repeat protein|nr:DUF2135 domain-containing protein [Azoarcus sp.]